ncbi:hypothetical protein EJ08DRAFT_561693, partial [Tothia fuscella]
SLLPQCSSCARSYLDAGHAAWRPFQQQAHQTRGAKSLRNQPDTIPVYLQKHVDGFGKKGSYVPISLGQMRNRWYPQGLARYVVGDELSSVKTGKISVERDSEFEAARYSDARLAKMADIARRKGEVRVRELLSPQRSLDLLAVLLPSKLEFYRPVVTSSLPSTSSPSSSSTNNPSAIPKEVLSILSSSPASPKQSSQIPIYGSISTLDVANHIKEYISYNDEASQVVLNENDVKFVGLGQLDDVSRVKHLGEYGVEIGMKGVEGKVSRRVVVAALE